MKLRLSFFIFAAVAVAGCGSSGGDAPVANQAPAVSAISDQSITANQAAPTIAFAVADDRTEPASLTVEGMSSNPSIIADDGIAIDGSGADRSLTVTPVIDEIGTAVISVMVTDQEGLSDAASFSLTVEPQSLGISAFTREGFADSDEGEPMLINSVVFDQDADNDEFADLLE